MPAANKGATAKPGAEQGATAKPGAKQGATAKPEANKDTTKLATRTVPSLSTNIAKNEKLEKIQILFSFKESHKKLFDVDPHNTPFPCNNNDETSTVIAYFQEILSSENGWNTFSEFMKSNKDPKFPSLTSDYLTASSRDNSFSTYIETFKSAGFAGVEGITSTEPAKQDQNTLQLNKRMREKAFYNWFLYAAKGYKAITAEFEKVYPNPTEQDRQHIEQLKKEFFFAGLQQTLSVFTFKVNDSVKQAAFPEVYPEDKADPVDVVSTDNLKKFLSASINKAGNIGSPKDLALARAQLRALAREHGKEDLPFITYNGAMLFSLSEAQKEIIAKVDTALAVGKSFSESISLGVGEGKSFLSELITKVYGQQSHASDENGLITIGNEKVVVGYSLHKLGPKSKKSDGKTITESAVLPFCTTKRVTASRNIPPNGIAHLSLSDVSTINLEELDKKIDEIIAKLKDYPTKIIIFDEFPHIDYDLRKHIRKRLPESEYNFVIISATPNSERIKAEEQAVGYGNAAKVDNYPIQTILLDNKDEADKWVKTFAGKAPVLVKLQNIQDGQPNYYVLGNGKEDPYARELMAVNDEQEIQSIKSLENLAVKTKADALNEKLQLAQNERAAMTENKENLEENIRTETEELNKYTPELQAIEKFNEIKQKDEARKKLKPPPKEGRDTRSQTEIDLYKQATDARAKLVKEFFDEILNKLSPQLKNSEPINAIKNLLAEKDLTKLNDAVQKAQMQKIKDRTNELEIEQKKLRESIKKKENEVKQQEKAIKDLKNIITTLNSEHDKTSAPPEESSPLFKKMAITDQVQLIKNPIVSSALKEIISSKHTPLSVGKELEESRKLFAQQFAGEKLNGTEKAKFDHIKFESWETDPESTKSLIGYIKEDITNNPTEKNIQLILPDLSPLEVAALADTLRKNLDQTGIKYISYYDAKGQVKYINLEGKPCFTLDPPDPVQEGSNKFLMIYSSANHIGGDFGWVSKKVGLQINHMLKPYSTTQMQQMVARYRKPYSTNALGNDHTVVIRSTTRDREQFIDQMITTDKEYELIDTMNVFRNAILIQLELTSLDKELKQQFIEYLRNSSEGEAGSDIVKEWIRSKTEADETPLTEQDTKILKQASALVNAMTEDSKTKLSSTIRNYKSTVGQLAATRSPTGADYLNGNGSKLTQYEIKLKQLSRTNDSLIRKEKLLYSGDGAISDPTLKKTFDGKLKTNEQKIQNTIAKVQTRIEKSEAEKNKMDSDYDKAISQLYSICTALDAANKQKSRKNNSHKFKLQLMQNIQALNRSLAAAKHTVIEKLDQASQKELTDPAAIANDLIKAIETVMAFEKYSDADGVFSSHMETLCNSYARALAKSHHMQIVAIQYMFKKFRDYNGYVSYSMIEQVSNAIAKSLPEDAEKNPLPKESIEIAINEVFQEHNTIERQAFRREWKMLQSRLLEKGDASATAWVQPRMKYLEDAMRELKQKGAEYGKQTEEAKLILNIKKNPGNREYAKYILQDKLQQQMELLQGEEESIRNRILKKEEEFLPRVAVLMKTAAAVTAQAAQQREEALQAEDKTKQRKDKEIEAEVFAAIDPEQTAAMQALTAEEAEEFEALEQQFTEEKLQAEDKTKQRKDKETEAEVFAAIGPEQTAAMQALTAEEAEEFEALEQQFTEEKLQAEDKTKQRKDKEIEAEVFAAIGPEQTAAMQALTAEEAEEFEALEQQFTEEKLQAEDKTKQRKDKEIEAEVFAAIDPEQTAAREAATNIQRIYRGHQVRAELKRQEAAATNIQRVYRGYLARAKATNAERNIPAAAKRTEETLTPPPLAEDSTREAVPPRTKYSFKEHKTKLKSENAELQDRIREAIKRNPETTSTDFGVAVLPNDPREQVFIKQLTKQTLSTDPLITEVTVTFDKPIAENGKNSSIATPVKFTRQIVPVTKPNTIDSTSSNFTANPEYTSNTKPGDILIKMPCDNENTLRNLRHPESGFITTVITDLLKNGKDRLEINHLFDQIKQPISQKVKFANDILEACQRNGITAVFTEDLNEYYEQLKDEIAQQKQTIDLDLPAHPSTANHPKSQENLSKLEASLDSLKELINKIEPSRIAGSEISRRPPHGGGIGR